LVEEDIEGAIKGFEKVLSLEKEKGDWGFKALKKLIKLYFQVLIHFSIVTSFQSSISRLTTLHSNLLCTYPHFILLITNEGRKFKESCRKV
jgi:hypothetical protein